MLSTFGSPGVAPVVAEVQALVEHAKVDVVKNAPDASTDNAKRRVAVFMALIALSPKVVPWPLIIVKHFAGRLSVKLL